MSSQTFCIIRLNDSFIKGEYTLFSMFKMFSNNICFIYKKMAFLCDLQFLSENFQSQFFSNVQYFSAQDFQSLSIDHECRWMCWMCTLPSGPSVVCVYMDGVRRHFRPFLCQKLCNADCL